MDAISDLLAFELHGVPVISILTAILAFVTIIPFWAAAVRMTSCPRLRGMRIGATLMVGPLIWYLVEPIWLWFGEADPSTNMGVVSLLLAVAIYFWWTQSGRMRHIESIRQDRELTT